MFFDVKFTRTTVGAHQGDYIWFPGDGSNAGDYDDGSDDSLRAKKASYAEVTGLIPLPTGDYGFLITAYNNEDGDLPIAGKTGTITVSVSTIDMENIALDLLTGTNPKTGLDYKGIFSYTVKLPTNNTLPTGLYETKKLEVFEYTAWKGGTASDLANVTLNESYLAQASKSGTIELPIGYYIVKVTVSKTHYITRQYTEALHIYTGFTSELDLTVPALIQNEFKVSFNMNGKLNTNSTDDFSDEYIKYGTPKADPGDPEADNYDFLGWFQNAAGTGNSWNFDHFITGTLELFAKWLLNAVFPITLNTPTLEDDIPPTISDGPSLERGNLDGNGSITLTLSGTWDTNSIVWSINDEVDALVDIGKSGTYHGNTLQIRNGGAFMSVIAGSGNTSFMVYVYAESGGVPYSAFIVVPVTGSYTP